MMKLIYTFFLGLLVVLFIADGIAAFYPKPKEPDYPKILEKTEMAPGTTETPEIREARVKFDKELKAYGKKNALYNRNVSVISLAFSLIMLTLSLVLPDKLLIISDGLLLGGIFTVAYSIIRGFSSEDEKYRFIIVSIGLLITLFLGYIKLVKPAETKANS